MTQTGLSLAGRSPLGAGYRSPLGALTRRLNTCYDITPRTFTIAGVTACAGDIPFIGYYSNGKHGVAQIVSLASGTTGIVGQALTPFGSGGSPSGCVAGAPGPSVVLDIWGYDRWGTYGYQGRYTVTTLVTVWVTMPGMATAGVMWDAQVFTWPESVGGRLLFLLTAYAGNGVVAANGLTCSPNPPGSEADCGRAGHGGTAQVAW